MYASRDGNHSAPYRFRPLDVAPPAPHFEHSRSIQSRRLGDEGPPMPSSSSYPSHQYNHQYHLPPPNYPPPSRHYTTHQLSHGEPSYSQQPNPAVTLPRLRVDTETHSHYQLPPFPSATHSQSSLHDTDPDSSSPLRDATPLAVSSRDRYQDRDNSQDKKSSPTTPPVIACKACRTRKIRCNSIRPRCENCEKRNNDCEYDVAPKRRGPDKRPGTRQRSCKKRPADGSIPPPPKRKKLDDGPRSAATTSSTRETRSSYHSISPESPNSVVSAVPRSSPLEHSRPSVSAPTGSLRLSRDNGYYDSPPPHHGPSSSLGRAVSDHSSRSPVYTHQPGWKSWWDRFIENYKGAPTEQVLVIFVDEIQFLMDSTSNKLSFICPSFVQALKTEERNYVQPAFILAALAMAALIRASERGEGRAGRERAVWYRNAAHDNLNESYKDGRIDTTLAAAAFILALFENSAHPEYKYQRESDSLVVLDNIIRALGLTTIDRGDPDASYFSPNEVPVVTVVKPRSMQGRDIDYTRRSSMRPCQCPPTSSATEYAATWSANWTAQEVENESCRRLCWGALQLISAFSSQCVMLGKAVPAFHLASPSNFALLFPGELTIRAEINQGVTYTICRTSGTAVQSGKESTQALLCRLILLWNYCARFDDDIVDPGPRQPDEYEWALDAWSETQVAEDILDLHICSQDAAVSYTAKEYLYNTRMRITKALRRFQSISPPPNAIPDRRESEGWFRCQEQVVKRIKIGAHNLNTTQGQLLTRRPFQVTWLVNQLEQCLILWQNDNDFTNGLQLGKDIIESLHVLIWLWPCPNLEARFEILSERVSDACTSMGIPRPRSISPNPPLQRSGN